MEILRIDGVFLRLAKTDGVTTRTGELATTYKKARTLREFRVGIKI